MSRSGYGSEEDDLDIHVRRYQRDRSPGPQYVQTVRDNRPRGYYQSGPVFLAPERSSGTMITTRTSRSRSRDRRSSPPQQMAPVVIENKIINEHSSDSDSDYHHGHGHRHRHRDRSRSSSYHDDRAIERVRREYDEMRLRDEERERAARRAVKDARDQSELIRAKAELDEIKRDQERHEAEKRAKRELELKYLEEERRREEEKKRREKEAEEAVEKYKLKEAERAAKEKEEKERAEKDYKARMTADLLAAGVDEKEIVAILEKKKLKKEDKDKDRPTYTRMSLRHLDIETLVYYKIEFEYDQEPGFILIKRWVPEWEQDMLWAHTRKLRVVEKKKHKHEDKLVLEIEDKKHHHHHGDKLGDDQFEWVRKKERRRSKSPGLLMYLAGAKPA